jgi:drug/metabolite transporter (DMT)-like permease
LQVSPVVAVVLGVVVLDDPLTIQLVAGVVLSLAGVFVVAMARQA